ncbi:Putative arsenical resistance operon repressor ArsR2 [uncultured archaeon]|nr:Putative arsenical resistance operon repressor ArsR2 [uncultured archaeon]
MPKECTDAKNKRKIPPARKIRETTRKMKLLSHPARLSILLILKEGPTCVCVIKKTLGLPQPTVSQHLAKLKDAGIIDCNPKGKYCYYQIKDHSIKPLTKLL